MSGLKPNLKIYDSHTHLNDDVFYSDVPAYLARARHFGVVEMNMIGSNELLNQRAIELAHRYQGMHAVIGWHPEDIARFDAAAEKTLLNQLEDPSVVGIGEIGLDYFNDEHSPHDDHKRIFERQLAIAKDMHLPVSIHCRDALADTYQILKSAHVDEFGGVMHSFNGDVEWMKRFLDLGMEISYSGVVTFNSAKDVQEAMLKTPLEHLLVETDAPYLTPVPYRGQQNEPGFTRFTVEKIAELREQSSVEVALATFDNASRLFLNH